MFGFFFIKDLIEIVFFSSIVYFFSLWLKKDRRNNLILYFYGYYALFAITTLIHLPTMSAFLLYSSPIVLILFIVFHQDILQKNFITMRNKPVMVSEDAVDWPENLIRASLYGINNNKQILCVIEHYSDLKPFLNAPFIFNSPLHQNMLNLLIDSSNFDQHKLLWCNTHGKLIGINATWINTQNQEIQHSKELPAWQQDALLMTLKTDTIVFKADPIRRSFDIIVKGVAYEGISANNALTIIKKHIQAPIHFKGDTTHDNTRQTPFFEQQNH
jgi:hypothetical protein